MKAIIAGKEIELKKVSGQWVPDSLEGAVIERLDEDRLLISTPTRVYEFRLLGINREEKTLSLQYGNSKVEIKIKEPLDDLLHEMGLDKPVSSMLKTLKAPMPGLVLGVHVQPGDVVKKDDKLLVLEAMKMENVIKSPGEGVVSKVLVQQGEAVDKNQVMMEFE